MAVTAGSACALLSEPDRYDEKPDGKWQVIVSVHLRGAEAQRFMAAEPGDPEQWELVNVSTKETFTPYDVDHREVIVGDPLTTE